MTEVPEIRRWFSYAEASDWLGMSERQLRRAVAARKIAHTRLGGARVYFSQQHLDDYVGSRPW
jgi:excisionase family DNA binding protein